MLTINTSITDFLKATYPALWVETHEENRCINSLMQQVPTSEEYKYQFFTWDSLLGMKIHSNNDYDGSITDPIQAIQYTNKVPQYSIIFLKDMHRLMESVQLIRAVKNAITHCKANKIHLIFIAPMTKIPIELEKDITCLDFPLPTEDELIAQAKELVEENKNLKEIIDIDSNEAIQAIKAGVGLTIGEAENTFARTIISKRKFDRSIIEEDKLQAIKKSGLMELFNPVPESELGGLSKYKRFIHNRKEGFFNKDLPTPKSVMFIGPPGTGKSLGAKVTASILGFPLIKLDLSALKGGIVGETERNTRKALQLAKSVAPCVIWVEEVEKSLGGAQSSNKTDGGTTSNMVGIILTEIQEMTEPVFFISTCNDIDALLEISQGALLRRLAEEMFFVDLPNLEERKEILGIMNKKYNTNIEGIVNKIEGWSGAEVEKFVKSSIYDGIDEAFSNIKPLSIQNKDKIDKARKWALSNARMANENNNAVEKKGRKIEL